MTVLKVIEWPAEVLETRADEVQVFDEKLKAFVADMQETMKHYGGIGLSANQVDSLQRVLVIHVPYRKEDRDDGEVKAWWHDKQLVLVNPVIKEKHGRIKSVEGCLSFPEIYEYIDRYEAVTVVAQDVDGKSFEIKTNDFLAIVIQHELDHLDGIVMIDRMSRLKAGLVRKKLMKRGQKVGEAIS